jgi:predicted NBD/HSP70 family sugar kinase
MPVPSVLTILRAVKERGSISRTDLQQLTGLSWGTITNTTRDLIARRLIREEGATATKAGRKPVRLALNRLSHCLWGLHLEPTHLRLLALNLTGETLAAENIPFSPDTPPAEALTRAANTLKNLASTPHLAGRSCLGIGVALPGAIDHAHGLLRNAPRLPSWKNLPVRTLLAAATGLTVHIERTVNCIALAERWFGAAGDVENLLCLHLDHDIDLGLILNGQIFRGTANLAGNIAHLPLSANTTLHGLCAPLLSPPANAPAPPVDALGQALCQTLHIAIGLFDPQAILLSGSLPAAHSELTQYATRALEAAHRAGHNAELLTTRIPADAPAAGACGMVLDAAFDTAPVHTPATLAF